jgi:AmmeMemoRadiSam system protein A
MSIHSLSHEDRIYLLQLARNSIKQAIQHQALPKIDIANLSSELKSNGATFVTLTIDGQLRGCIGALEAYQPLAKDVQEHAVSAALEDYRFPPLTWGDLDSVRIEISRLTQPIQLIYSDTEALIQKLRPSIDGVILADGFRRATFLPQVWEQLPIPEEFLNHLCVKMGSNPDTWQKKHLEVSTYQVEEFHE